MSTWASHASFRNPGQVNIGQFTAQKNSPRQPTHLAQVTRQDLFQLHLLAAVSENKVLATSMAASAAAGMQMWLPGCAWPSSRCASICPVVLTHLHRLQDTCDLSFLPQGFLSFLTQVTFQPFQLPFFCPPLQLSRPQAWCGCGQAGRAGCPPFSGQPLSPGPLRTSFCVLPPDLNSTAGTGLVSCGGPAAGEGSSGCAQA